MADIKTLRLQLQQIMLRLAQQPDDVRLLHLASKIQRLIELSETSSTAQKHPSRPNQSRSKQPLLDVKQPEAESSLSAANSVSIASNGDTSAERDQKGTLAPTKGIVHSMPEPKPQAKTVKTTLSTSGLKDDEQHKKQQTWLQFSSQFRRK